MSKPIAGISNLNHLQSLQGIHPAWLEAGYGIASATPTYYSWQTLPSTDFSSPRQSLDSLPSAFASGLDSPRTTLPQQKPQIASVSGFLPQVPAGASGNGASAELNQLLNSMGTLTTDVMNQSALLDQAQKQVEQQKLALQQLQPQQQQQKQVEEVSQLQQQQAILAQQVAALKQQTVTPANGTMPMVNGAVASTMPSLYSSTFTTKGMGLTASLPTVSQASVSPSTPTGTDTKGTIVSATPSLTAMDEKSKKISDGKLTLVDIGVGKYQLDSEAANAFKKANDEVKKQTGEGIAVISAYRSPEHNERVGGAPNSNHTRGGSLDLDPGASNYQKSLQILEANGFKSLRGVIYDKPGSGPQDEENHLDFVGNKA